MTREERMAAVDETALALIRAAEKLLGDAASAYVRGREPRPNAAHMGEIRAAFRKLEEL